MPAHGLALASRPRRRGRLGRPGTPDLTLESGRRRCGSRYPRILDAFYDHGDPIKNVTLHRANSHALFWQTLASLPLAVATAKLLREMNQLTRWWLAIWLILITHALLDWMTVYGTQLGLPFTDFPFAIGNMFIIDPLYTLPLLIGVGVALALRNPRD